MPGHYNDNWEWVDDEIPTDDPPTGPPTDPDWRRHAQDEAIPPGSPTTGSGTVDTHGHGQPAPNDDYTVWVLQNGEWVATPRHPENTIPTTTARMSDYQRPGGGPYQFAPLNWPDWNPPEFAAPPAFAYADFKPPTIEEAMNEPGYKFAADEGAKRIQNNAAARGNVVGGGAIKDLVKWANDYATQNYNGVYSRGLQTYSTNRNNAADNYMTNYNVSRDVFDRKYTSYAAGDQSRRQKATLDFQRDWDIYQSDLDTKKYLATVGNQ